MSLQTDSPDAKKPCKGILKSSSSFDKHATTAAAAASSVHRKSAKFDELNVLQTYHPPDKDYGHMKVDEPKTPYNYEVPEDCDQLDAELLAEKLRVAANSKSDSLSDEESSEEEEEDLTEEQKQHKLEFEKRRKAHYNEFEAIKLARKLIEEEDEDDGDNDASKSLENSRTSDDSPDKQKMEVEEQDEVDKKSGDEIDSQQPAVTLGTAVGQDLESVRTGLEGSPIRITRRSVISFIVLICAVLTIVSMICVLFLFQLI